MNPDSGSGALLQAELQYAAFNARRTTPGEAGAVVLGGNESFAWVFDPARPAHGYFSRAVCGAAVVEAPDPAQLLPPDIRAVELWPQAACERMQQALSARGFRPAHTLCYLARAPAHETVAPARIERLAHAQVDDFFDLLEIEGVEFPPDKRDRKRAFYCSAEFESFVSRDSSGTACAWATLFTWSRTAFLGNVFTRPEQRRAGHHAALLEARLRRARELDLELVFTDVEPASQSHVNCERAGFRTLTVNTVWLRAD